LILRDKGHENMINYLIEHRVVKKRKI